MSEPRVWVNGQFIALEAPGLSPRDRGFTLGDGIFETMRARGGEIFALHRHLARLQRGAAILALAIPTPVELADALATVLADVSAAESVVVRLSVSRGIPHARGLLPDPEAAPSVVIHRLPLLPYPARFYHQGMRAVVSAITRNEGSPLATIKSLCYLDNVLARREAAERGADEALLRNTRGEIVCASAMNLFAVIDQTLVTPPAASGALPGTVRALILEELAPQLGLPTFERPLTDRDLASCTEAFLTNALAGAVPLIRVDDQTIGEGKPGPHSRRLQALLTRAWG